MMIDPRQEYVRVWLTMMPGTTARTMRLRLSRRAPASGTSVAALLSRGQLAGDSDVEIVVTTGAPVDGKSAYDQARDEGFSGTVSQWLASLKGDTGPAGLGTVTPSTPARAIGTAFRPSTTKATLCIYSVKTQVTNPLLVGTSTSMVRLLSDAAATPTTERARVEATSGVGITVTIALTTSNTATLVYLVPAGHYVLLSQTIAGTGTASIVSQCEIALG